jgi:hypothetical protein
VNVYQITEDRERRLFVAENMPRAIEAAFAHHLAENPPGYHEVPKMNRGWTPEEIVEERKHWEATILESCTHVGELENPVAVAFACRTMSGELAPVTLEDVRAFLIALDATGCAKLVDVTDADLGPLQALLEAFLVEHATEEPE